MGIFRKSQPEQRAVLSFEGGIDLAEFADDTSGVLVSQQTATRSTAAYASMRLLSDTVSTLPVYEVEQLGGVRQRADEQPAWLSRPNTYSSRVDFFSDVMMSCVLDGNAFILVAVDPTSGDIVEAHVLDPRQVLIERSLTSKVTFSVPLADGSRVQLPPASQLTEMGIVHVAGIRRPGTARGLSPIRECSQSLGLALAATAYSASLLGKSAVPHGVIEVSSMLDQKQAKELLSGWKLGRTGPSSAGLPAVLSGGAQWKPLTLSPADVQLLETLRFSVRDIARLFRVPAWLIGDDATMSYASTEQEMLSFVTHSVRPWLVRIEEAFAQVLPDGRQLRFDTGGLLKADTKSRYEAYAIAITNGLMSVNEARRLEDLAPVDGGDENLRPLNMAPIAQTDA